jgi:RimJ/RimL family protein N-acetyltransferase
MAWADVAVAGAGSTAWELAFMGLPSALIVLADNQLAVASALEREAVSLSLGWHAALSNERIGAMIQDLVLDQARRENMSRLGRKLVDGLGVERVTTKMRAAQLGLRRATEKDSPAVWEWANDPMARAMSFSSEPIPWPRHVQWYSAKLADPSCFFYIAESKQGEAIGQIRFELSGAEGTLSVSLAPSAQGRGWGSALIARGAEQLFQDSEVNVINAYVKTGNRRSERALEKADFQPLGVVEVKNHSAHHYAMRRAAV